MTIIMWKPLILFPVIWSLSRVQITNYTSICGVLLHYPPTFAGDDETDAEKAENTLEPIAYEISESLDLEEAIQPKFFIATDVSENYNPFVQSYKVERRMYMCLERNGDLL